MHVSKDKQTQADREQKARREARKQVAYIQLASKPGMKGAVRQSRVHHT